MAEICCGLVSDGETSRRGESSSRAARRRRMEIRRFKFVTGVAPPPETTSEREQKRPKCKARDCEKAVENCVSEEEKQYLTTTTTKVVDCVKSESSSTSEQMSKPLLRSYRSAPAALDVLGEIPKFGFSSVCGRRRDMEDAFAIYPSFCRRYPEIASELHYFGVYDGHGCSHVRYNFFFFTFKSKFLYSIFGSEIITGLFLIRSRLSAENDYMSW